MSNVTLTRMTEIKTEHETGTAAVEQIKNAVNKWAHAQWLDHRKVDFHVMIDGCELTINAMPIGEENEK